MHEPLSNEELRWGYWYFVHRAALRRVAALLAVVGCSLLAYSGWQLIDWFASRRAEEEALRFMVSSTVNVAEYRRRHQPLPLEVGTVTAVSRGAGMYDLVAQVKNPNPAWAVERARYTLVAAAAEVTGERFFLPLEETYLVHSGVKLAGAPASVQLTLGELSWLRIRPERDLKLPNFAIEGEQFERLEEAGTGLRFTLKNKSPYSFYEASVVVVLTYGGAPVAVGQQLLANVESGSSRPVRFSWPTLTVVPDRLVVKPEVNVLDPRVFKPL